MESNELKGDLKRGTKVKQSGTTQGSTCPVRLKRGTKAKLDDFLRRANKKEAGKRIKPDDLVGFSLDLLTDDHLDQICDRSLTNKDRLEMLFKKVAKERRGTTRDEFLGMLLDGKVSF